MATHQTRFKIVYGQLASSPVTYEIDTTKNNEVKKKLINMNVVFARVKTKLRRAQEKIKSYYDEGIRDINFDISNYVFLKL